MFTLDKFMNPDAARKLRDGSLHKVAAVMAKNAGTPVGDEVTLESTAFLIGKKAYVKKASLRKIKAGLFAYNDLTGEGE